MSLLDELPKRKWVKNESRDFLTIDELQKATGEGRNWCERYAKGMIDSGKWEVRYKRGRNGKPIRALGHEPRK